MRTPCEEAVEWLATQGTGAETRGFEVAATHTAHLISCGTCGRIHRQYEEFVEGAGVALEYAPRPEMELSLLAAMSARPTRQPAVRYYRLRILLGLAAAAVLGVLLGGSATRLLATPSKPARVTAADPPPTHVQIAGYHTPQRTTRLPSVEGPPEASPAPSAPQASLVAGTQISTSREERRFEDPQNATLTVGVQTRLDVQAWTRAETRLALHHGQVTADVEHRLAGETFEILTDNARVIVVGTLFSVSYDPRVGTRVVGSNGRVRVEDRSGILLGYVNGGQEIDVPVGPVSKARLARRLLAEGKDDEAIATLLEIESRTWEEEGILADAYLLANDLAEAERSYREAVRLAPSPDAGLLVDLATTQAQSDAGRASRTWESYLKAFPDGRQASPARLFIAEHALASGEVEKATRHLDVLVSTRPLPPQATPALAHLGAHYLAEERWDDAERLFVGFLHESDERGETALVGMASVDMGRLRPDLAEQRLSTYESRFRTRRREHEVASIRERIRAHR